jgi:hypothetical protein
MTPNQNATVVAIATAVIAVVLVIAAFSDSVTL